MLVQRSMDAQLRAVRLILAQPFFSRGALYSPLVKLFVMNDYNCTRGTFRLSPTRNDLPSLGYWAGSLVGYFLSSRGSELSRSGSSSISAEPAREPSLGHVA